MSVLELNLLKIVCTIVTLTFDQQLSLLVFSRPTLKEMEITDSV